jgi:hypothetical protein
MIMLYQWRLLRGGRLIIMSGMESNYVFDAFDTIPLIPLPAITTSSSSQMYFTFI